MANVTNERLAGATRYGTAAAIAGDEVFATPSHVIIATGENFPDALAASTLSGARGVAPILLTQTSVLTQETAAGLDALRAKGVTTATIVGGTAAVSEGVQTAIAAKGFTVTRVAGTNRYETAAAIASAADAIQDSGSVGGQKTALIATGVNFPDALAGGPAAVRNDLPLLLVETNSVPASTRSALTSLGITRTVILGGTAAVSEAVAAELQTATGSAPQRLAGVNRFGTAAAVGDYEITTLAFPATAAVLATGMNFPDALASGPLGGLLGAPIVLTASLPEESRAFLDKHSNRITKLYVSGGTAAIDDATVAAAEAAAETVGNDTAASTATVRPELVSARIVETITSSTATPSRPAGTYVMYTFDEAVGTSLATVPNRFKIYNTNSTLAATGTSATLGAGGTTVEVYFATPNTAAAAATLTVATVDDSAVFDANGLGNPEGDAAIGSASSTTPVGGQTTAPDLVSVGGFRQAALVGQTAVDFTFDAPATVQGTTGFQLVTTSNALINCTSSTTAAPTAPSGGTVAGGSTTNVITVICTNPGGTPGTVAGTPLTASNVARGVTQPDAVRSASGTGNPLEAADVANSGNTTTPVADLVSVSLVQATNAADVDRALFTFDRNVSSANANLFFAYTTTAAEIMGVSAAISATDPTQVLVSFASSTALDTAVGGNVRAGATEGATAADTNQPDEAPALNPAATGQTTGRTDAPDLTAVAVTATSGFSPASATFTFDSNVSTNEVLGNFHLYTADGTRLTATTCNRGSSFAGGADSTSSSNAVSCVFGLVGNSTVNSQVINAVIGTVDAGAVTSEAGALTNPEGAERTTGGTGTPAS